VFNGLGGCGYIRTDDSADGVHNNGDTDLRT
jgi:hypothetical protein